MFKLATTTVRQTARSARPQALFSTSARSFFPAQGGVPPTTSQSSLGTDRGSSLRSDAEEGAQEPTLSKISQTTNTSPSSAANTQSDPNHPADPAKTAGEGNQAHIASLSRGEPGTQKDGVAAGGNPLKPAGTGRGYHTSAVLRAASKPVEEQSAQHPGKSDIDHLENPSLSEEVVHADRETADPLAASAKASAKIDDAADHLEESAKGAAKQAEGAAKEAAKVVKDALGKRTFSTSAISRKDEPEEQSAQHPGKSGHDHLDNPSMSEETVHADRTEKDPLPKEHKASTKKKTEESAGVKDKVSELKKKPVDDLPDGESTLRSMGGGN
ncbi:hypothetical protein JCM11641_006326 [Rhodosporidiobolus odoratus]